MACDKHRPDCSSSSAAALRSVAFTSVAANLSAVTGGILVFSEPIGSGPLAIGARLVAFCMVVAGAPLMPSHPAEQREPDFITTPIRDTA